MQLRQTCGTSFLAVSKRELKTAALESLLLGRQNKPKVYWSQGNKLGLHFHSRAPVSQC